MTKTVKNEVVFIDGSSLDFTEVVDVACKNKKVAIKPEQKDKMKKSREVIDKAIEKEEIIYGVNTGFGRLSEVVISNEKMYELQKNLILSHSTGVGDPLSEKEVRATMLLRANSLVRGYSGIRLETINTLLELLNKKVHPVIPEKGSLGASGDLAPLAHMVLVLMGLGEAFYEGERLKGELALERANIAPVNLHAKEGLALINGTQIMTSIGVLNMVLTKNLIKSCDIISAMTVEALEGIPDAFDSRIFDTRPHTGAISTAQNLRVLLKDSEIIAKSSHGRVQDSYSIRCIPQVHGASKDAFSHIENILKIEINSTTDNPIIFSDDNEVLSGGNFHGQPVAIAMDYMSIALSELANISERRVERLVNPELNADLPGFLIKNGGINSGYQILQYTAASLVSENKSLSHPASVDSIPSSGNQEDHVSMGTIASRKAREILENTIKVLAIELICSAQALDYRKPLKGGVGTSIAHRVIREVVPHLKKDRESHEDIEKAAQLIRSGSLAREVEARVELED